MEHTRGKRNSVKNKHVSALRKSTRLRSSAARSEQVRKNKTNVLNKRRRIEGVGRKNSQGEMVSPARMTAQEFEGLLETLKKDTYNASDKFAALQKLKAGLTVFTPERMDQVAESGVIPVLVEMLEHTSPLTSATRSGEKVCVEILWCLTNITSGLYEHTKLVLPAVPKLLQFLQGGNPQLAEHAAWTIGNIAADCEEFRQYLIANGAIVPLVKQLENQSEIEVVKSKQVKENDVPWPIYPHFFLFLPFSYSQCLGIV